MASPLQAVRLCSDGGDKSDEAVSLIESPSNKLQPSLLQVDAYSSADYLLALQMSLQISEWNVMEGMGCERCIRCIQCQKSMKVWKPVLLFLV